MKKNFVTFALVSSIVGAGLYVATRSGDKEDREYIKTTLKNVAGISDAEAERWIESAKAQGFSNQEIMYVALKIEGLHGRMQKLGMTKEQMIQLFKDCQVQASILSTSPREATETILECLGDEVLKREGVSP